ncbi:MAG: FliA/WhiG family RNA polymerase sigma factor [Actinomycetota bacterium]|jgi:RNA polymerase sigma factor for flagellar operon FliA|nr:FliA/WhiG family RNA polymerase sigma factor [Actinomycetota bacterium]
MVICEADTVDRLWVEYKGSGHHTLRNRLMLHYSPLVKYVVGRVSSGLPQYVEQSDLMSYGMIGLMDAIGKYDLARGVRFETYAIPRIKGAIVDELRAVDWVPRSIRAKIRSVEQAYAKLEATIKRAPTDNEVAEELTMSVEEFQRLLQQISFVGVVPLDEVLPGRQGEGGGGALVDTIPDSSPGPVATFEVKEAKRLLADAISHLGEREKTVLTLYYYEGLTLSEIGDVLGVSESRVCQIHTKAILRLRVRVKAQEKVESGS